MTSPTANNDSESGRPIWTRINNAALITGHENTDFINKSIKALELGTAPILLAKEATLLSAVDTAAKVALPQVNSFENENGVKALLKALTPALSAHPGSPVLVDMPLSSDSRDGPATLRLLAQMVALLASDVPNGIVALYNRNALIENHMQSLLSAHPAFLAPSGLHDNPFWLPPALHRGSIDEQMSYFLSRLVPDYAEEAFFDEDGRAIAREYEPGWLSTPPRIDPLHPEGPQWHVRCLGQLRIYRDGLPLEWSQPGGSANKTRTLFAYLLMAGAKGVHVDQISEILWQKGDDSDAKRNRLHHCVAMLRRVLGSKSMVERSGEYYQLTIAPETWTDVGAFEQYCRRGLSLAKEGQEEDALRVYQSAETLYEGDLFADLPIEYTDGELDDWCMSRRNWLREMRMKLLRDMSVCLRSMQRSAEALQICQKARHFDPLSEEATMETMRVYHLQGRYDAITRLFRQFEEKVGADGITDLCNRTYKSLMR